MRAEERTDTHHGGGETRDKEGREGRRGARGQGDRIRGRIYDSKTVFTRSATRVLMIPLQDHHAPAGSTASMLDSRGIPQNGSGNTLERRARCRSKQYVPTRAPGWQSWNTLTVDSDTKRAIPAPLRLLPSTKVVEARSCTITRWAPHPEQHPFTFRLGFAAQKAISREARGPERHP